MSPSGKRDSRELSWALDNEMYVAWSKSGFSNDPDVIREHWDGLAFLDALTWALNQPTRPVWVVVPDVPGNATETRRAFDFWAPRMDQFRLAMAVQDGMSPSDVPDGVVAFVGGSTEWKWKNVERFCSECETTHVGRVNNYKRLWQCDKAGAASCDGSGFFRGDVNQRKGLVRYLLESSGYVPKEKQQLIDYIELVG